MVSSKKIFAGSALCLTLIGLAACTPADVQYCSRFGVEGTAEYGKCIDYYQQQSAAFASDREACAIEADMTYPPTLYDYGGYARSTIGTGWGGGRYGQYYGGQTIRIEPDFRRNAEVDRLRMRIIEPCMQARGWNSGETWQAGRSAVRPQKRKATPAKPLPWL